MAYNRKYQHLSHVVRVRDVPCNIYFSFINEMYYDMNVSLTVGHD